MVTVYITCMLKTAHREHVVYLLCNCDIIQLLISFVPTLQESLLDRQDFLHWLLDLLDKSKNADDLLLKFLIPLLLRVRYGIQNCSQSKIVDFSAGKVHCT